jgi:hypothetical protein
LALRGEQAEPAHQHPWRRAHGHLRADREEVHAEDGGIPDAAQRLREPANLQQIRKERVDDHADE